MIPGNEYELRVQVIDPRNLQKGRTMKLTHEYFLVGEHPTVFFGGNVTAVSGQTVFKNSDNVWRVAVRPKDFGVSVFGSIVSKGVSVLGCTVQSVQFHIPVTNIGTRFQFIKTMAAAFDKPLVLSATSRLQYKRDECSLDVVGLTFTGVENIYRGLAVFTDDFFQTQTFVDFLPLLCDPSKYEGQPPRELGNCARMALYELVIVGDFFLLLTSHGLFSVFFDGETAKLARHMVGVPAIDASAGTLTRDSVSLSVSRRCAKATAEHSVQRVFVLFDVNGQVGLTFSNDSALEDANWHVVFPENIPASIKLLTRSTRQHSLA